MHIFFVHSSSSLLTSFLPHFLILFLSDHPHVSKAIILVCGVDGFSALCELAANLGELMWRLGCGQISVPGRTLSTALEYSPTSVALLPVLQYGISTGTYTRVQQYSMYCCILVVYSTKFARQYNPAARKLRLCPHSPSSLLSSFFTQFSVFFISDHPHVSIVIVLVCVVVALTVV